MKTFTKYFLIVLASLYLSSCTEKIEYNEIITVTEDGQVLNESLIIEDKETKNISSDGGKIELKDGTSLEFLAGSVNGTKEISVETINPYIERNDVNFPNEFDGLSFSSIIKCKPDGIQFTEPVKITIPIIQELISEGIHLDSLVVLSNSDGIVDTIIPVINKYNYTASFETNHFTDFVLKHKSGKWRILTDYTKIGKSESNNLTLSYKAIKGTSIWNYGYKLWESFYADYVSQIIFYNIKIYRKKIFTDEYIGGKTIGKAWVQPSLYKRCVINRGEILRNGYEYYSKGLKTSKERRKVFEFDKNNGQNNVASAATMEVSFRKGKETDITPLFNRVTDFENESYLSNLTLDGVNTEVEIISMSSLGEGEKYYFIIEIIGDGDLANDNKYSIFRSSDFTIDDIGNNLTEHTQPIVVLTETLNITSSSFQCTSTINKNGAEIISHGICYNTNGSPTIDDLKVERNTNSETNTYEITELSPGTKYYVRAFAISVNGVGYSAETTITTEAVLPTVLTVGTENLGTKTSNLLGKVTDDGGNNVSQRGFLLSRTISNPTIESQSGRSYDGSGLGEFNRNHNDLIPNTLYYYRAWARNDVGFGYGEVKTFKTLSEGGGATIPTVITYQPGVITSNRTVLQGNVVSDGGSEITRLGFYWSQNNQNPNENDNVIESIQNSSGDFYEGLENLEAKTTYYYKAFAENNEGVGLGDVVTFTTNSADDDNDFTGESGTFTDSRDGHEYKWVKIGEQIWMAENLAFLPNVSPPINGSVTEPFYYVYSYNGNNISSAKQSINYRKHGVLYNWKSALQSCPSGWHLPSNEEWEQLAQYVSDQKGPYSKKNGTDWYEVGKHLKTTSGWSNRNGTDDFDFSALPSGERTNSNGGKFLALGNQSFWFSSTEDTSNNVAWVISVSSYWNDFIKNNWYKFTKDYGCSVRCIKD